MPESDIDKAYDLLVVIIGLVFSMMNANPELFWATVPDLPELSLEIFAIRGTIFPLLILAFLWLASRLISRENVKIVLKFVAWMIAFNIVVQAIFLYVHGAKFVNLNNSPIELIMISLLFIAPLLAHMLIFPKYKEMYPNATFFQRKMWSILPYVLSLLVIGTIIYVGSIWYVAW